MGAAEVRRTLIAAGDDQRARANETQFGLRATPLAVACGYECAFAIIDVFHLSRGGAISSISQSKRG